MIQSKQIDAIIAIAGAIEALSSGGDAMKKAMKEIKQSKQDTIEVFEQNQKILADIEAANKKVKAQETRTNTALKKLEEEKLAVQEKIASSEKKDADTDAKLSELKAEKAELKALKAEIAKDRKELETEKSTFIAFKEESMQSVVTAEENLKKQIANLSSLVQ